ncbi:MAG: TetR/AcrR family transcriptional regulator [Pseudomonadota bacterium]
MPAKDRIISVARRLIIDGGFEAVTTDRIAEHASVSKATIYKNFKNMEAVLAAVVDGELDRFSPREFPAIKNLADFRKTLHSYGVNLLMFLNSPDAIKFSQTMQESARKHPRMAETFYQYGYAQAHRELTDLIDAAFSDGFLNAKAPASDVAEDFLGQLEGFGFIQAQLGLTDTPYPDPESRASRAVETLCVLYKA